MDANCHALTLILYITYRELMVRGFRHDYCDLTSTDYRCVNEGKAFADDVVMLDIEEAKALGLIKEILIPVLVRD